MPRAGRPAGGGEAVVDEGVTAAWDRGGTSDEVGLGEEGSVPVT